MKLLQKSRN